MCAVYQRTHTLKYILRLWNLCMLVLNTHTHSLTGDDRHREETNESGEENERGKKETSTMRFWLKYTHTHGLDAIKNHCWRFDKKKNKVKRFVSWNSWSFLIRFSLRFINHVANNQNYFIWYQQLRLFNIKLNGNKCGLATDHVTLKFKRLQSRAQTGVLVCESNLNCEQISLKYLY